MDLYKAFATFNHNLLLVKQNANGVSFSTIKLVQIYLPEQFQRVNINNNFIFIKWCKILHTDQFYVPFYSIFSLTTFSISYKMLIFAILLMILDRIESKLKMSTLYRIIVKNKNFTTNPLFI